MSLCPAPKNNRKTLKNCYKQVAVEKKVKGKIKNLQKYLKNNFLFII